MERTFDLLVTALQAAGSYRVHADSETQGQAEGTLALQGSSGVRSFSTPPVDMEAQGATLYRALFSGQVGTLFNQALGEVLGADQGVLRLRLRIDPSELAVVPWELLYDPDRGRFLSAWPTMALSRTLGLLEPVRPLSAPGQLGLLALFPRSSGLATEGEKRTLDRLASDTAGRIAVRRLDDAVTVEAIRAALRRSETRIVHFAGHGTFVGDEAAISLDHPLGAGAQPIPAAAFARLLQESGTLRLVVLNSCLGATRSSVTALAGMAPQLLRHGVPAVVAMQAPVRNERALAFAAELYRGLAADRGRIDRAVTQARSALLQEEPRSFDFAAPVLYLRAPNGRLWPADAATTSPPGGGAATAVAARLPLPPASFLGRAGDLRALKAALCDSPGASAERAALRLVTGWPGVGKTTMTTALAHDPDLRQAFPDGVLWTSLDQSPNLLTELASWCIALGSPGPSPAASLGEASRLLAGLLNRRRVLLLVDDVWETAHAAPFLVGGRGCSMLVTTRLDAVAAELASTSESIYRLPLLSEEAGFELLRSRAPEVTARFPEECRVLVRELEGLPLALHVAGRMLAEDCRLWSPGELLETLRESRQLLEQKAPGDRADLSRQTLPTLAALLAKSTERLAPELLERFAFLGVFAPKPATFDLPALCAVWDVEDAKPSVRSLVSLGLLEAVGGERFRMHSLLVAHARSLLDP